MTSRILPSITLVLAFTIFLVYVNPTYSESISKLKETIAREQAALDAANRFHEQQDFLAEKKSSIPASDIERLAAFLPDSVDNVAAILDLTALATRSGLQLSSINASKSGISAQSTGASPVGSVDLTLSATGSYQAFRTFLTGVERSLRLLDVANISVQGSDTGVYAYTMTVRLYWLR